MIISHKYRFIFLKTNKTAGTSIEIALSKFCGEEDVITPVSLNDEEVRKNLGYRGPQNHLAPVSDYRLRDLKRLLVKRKLKERYFNHVSASRVKKHVGSDVWNSYYKFCFERNPWDRLISQYYWRCKSEPRPTISEFLETDVPLILKKRGYEIYSINGEVVVDRICRFENLAEEMERVRRLVGIPEPLVLPRTKSKYREDKRHYREVLNDEERKRIESLFSKEIELMGYEF